jgi:hypothetical protein
MLPLLISTPSLLIRAASPVLTPPRAQFASPPTADLLQHVFQRKRHHTFNVAISTRLFGSAALFVSHRAVLAYFIRQDLSFDRVLEGNLPRGGPHSPPNISAISGPAMRDLCHSASIIAPRLLTAGSPLVSLWELEDTRTPHTPFVELRRWHAANTSH